MQNYPENIEVSIICITYNQKDYLADALNSFLNQKTTFSYEILVHDDASTDGTEEVLRSFASKHPDKIRAFYEEENQFSKGIDFFSSLIHNHMRGKYIAYCEGDDFWVDAEKLQRQWEALEAHPECDMCACCVSSVTEDGKREISRIRPKEKDGILTAGEVIFGGGQYVGSAGLFYRKSLCGEPPEFERVISLDYVLQIRGALRGGIYYIDRMMACYRRYAKNSWTMNVLKNRERLHMQWEKEKEMLRVLDRDTEGRYKEVIRERLKAYSDFVEQLDERKDEILEMLSGLSGRIYMWGLGRRGEGFEEFCRNEGIRLDGVCDLTDGHIGETTEFGNWVFSSEEVLLKADVILASNTKAFQGIKNSGFQGKLVDLEPFMPRG